MLKFILLTFILFSQSNIRAEYNLNKFRLEGIAGFDRDTLLKYRGVGPELKPAQAMMAMLGHESSSMKSMLFDAVVLKLMMEPVYFESYLAGYLDSQILNDIQNELTNNGKKFEYDEAVSRGRKIVNKSFNTKYSENDILNYFIDYASYSYMDYPSDPREMIFSTVYMEIAANYSSHVAVINDRKNYAIDLNYYNYVKNSVWIRKIKPWPDKGEFVHAIEIPATDIEGYEIRRNFVRDFETFAPVHGKLNIAYYKTTFQNKNYVLVIDGKGEDGIVKNKDAFYYATSNINPIEDVPSLLSTTKKKAEVLGVVALCPINESCRVPKAIFEKYEIKGLKKLEANYINDIAKVSFNNMQGKLFYTPEENTSASIVNETTELKITDENEFLKKLATVDQATDSLLRVVDYRNDSSETPDSVEFSFTNEMKFNPGDSVYFMIPEKYRKREVKLIHLTHRKDIDAKSASFSTQIYANGINMWRVSSTQGRKGRTYSPEAADFSALKATSIDGWKSNEHLGFPAGGFMNTNLNGLAVRVVSMGSDSNYVNSLTVEFEKE